MNERVVRSCGSHVVAVAAWGPGGGRECICNSAGNDRGIGTYVIGEVTHAGGDAAVGAGGRYVMVGDS
jgi:hypothetical protein